MFLQKGKKIQREPQKKTASYIALSSQVKSVSVYYIFTCRCMPEAEAQWYAEWKKKGL